MASFAACFWLLLYFSAQRTWLAAFETKVDHDPPENVVSLQLNNFPNGNMHFSLMDVTGKILFEDQILIKSGLGEKTIDLSTFPNGMYLLVGNGFTQKLIIQH